jgi:hypothetical protein
MRNALYILVPALAALAVAASCDTNPCDDLEAYASTCPDPEVVAMVDRLIAANDKNTCRQYRDSWSLNFGLRCRATADAGPDAAPADAGESTDAPDMSDASDLPDAGDAGSAD